MRKKLGARLKINIAEITNMNIIENMRTQSANRFNRAGFSLGEVMILGAVITIIASFIMPTLDGGQQGFGRKSMARCMEQARLVVSIVEGAEAGGVHLLDPSGSVPETLRRLSAGVAVGEEMFAGQTFRVKTDASEIPVVAGFLRVENGHLVYVGS